jgi:serine/threonine protein kinase
VEILQRLFHPSIVRFKDFIEDTNRYYIVTEYFKGKSLHNEIY